MTRLGLIVMVLISAACAKGSRGAQGAERGDCRSGENKCDDGLVCLSNVCVRPPGADCQLVAETVTSFDLGNYAEPEERAPLVAKYKAACETAHVTKEEGQCLDKATDKWAAGQCAPKMFPQSAASKADCKAVIARIEEATKPQVQGLDQPQMKQWFETTIRVMQQSCEQDMWPDGLKKCILTAQAQPGVDAMQTCNGQMPPALQGKLQERLQTAMHEQMK
jgi:hypothetical protein